MNVLLIIPPESHSIESSLPKGLEAGKGVYPKLGLLYVAAHLEAHGGVTPEIVDCPAERLDYAQLERRLRQRTPDVVGLTTLTFNLIDAWKVVRLVKRIHPGAKVCVGGQHVTLYPQETLELEGVDFVVHGEGERVFTQLVRALERGGDPEELEQLAGLGYWRDGRARVNPQQDRVDDLDSLPQPARHLIDLSRYDHIAAEGNHLATMQTSRGCPAKCLFCDIRLTQFRKRSAENVLEELRYLVSRGIDDIFFVDDTITIDRGRLLEICELIERSGLKIHFKVSARVDTVKPHVLAALKRAGCYRIHYGVESATPRLLKYLQKQTTPDKIRQAFRWTHEAGIGTFAYCMIGIPTESYAEMMSTVDFAIELDPEYAQFSICTPYPKTALYQSMLEAGDVSHDYWRAFARNPSEDFRVRFWNARYSEAELRAFQSEAHRRFYSRLSYVARQARRVRSWGELRDKAKLGARILLRQLNRS
ncbi:MAG: B12-binding domain-containing radical SAM protein [Planctomycetes bacterium]|nr:B12-binding domain-containing radical SAM protein [Planctomycetota bacterium]